MCALPKCIFNLSWGQFVLYDCMNALARYCTWNLLADVSVAGAFMNSRVIAFPGDCICILLALHRLLAKSLVLTCKHGEKSRSLFPVFDLWTTKY